jgi:hypothetical protein
MATLRKVIRLALAIKTDAALLAFAQTVAALMTGNLNYPSPVNPTLLQLGGLITDFSDALSAWGTKGNRGSHAQNIAVRETRNALMDGLTSLADYCMNTTPYNEPAFVSGGWDVKSERSPVGLVGPVQFLRQIISILVPSGAVKLRWKRPANAPRGSVSAYRVLHSLTADINAAEEIGFVTRTTFTDLSAGSRPSNFYWVIPVCTAGDGGVADVVVGYPVGPVVI